MSPLKRCGEMLLAAAICSALSGCGMQGAPQPPSLNLPDTVTNLTAVRTGNQVSLAWTMPKRNTDKLPLKAAIVAHICRREGSNTCVSAGDVTFAPATAGAFTEALPQDLASGSPRPLTYVVELKNHSGRSAGPSNPAQVLAGAAPAPIESFSAEVRKEGVVLSWQPVSDNAPIRLHRRLLSVPPPKPHDNKLGPAPEPVEQTLLVEPSTPDAASQSHALDKSATLGQSYEYRAQRIARVLSDGQTIELAGELSPPVRVEVQDVFPPAVPSGLAAIATAPDSANAASVDLSWQPDSDTSLAGYEVYRREDETPWRRISGDQPVVGPAFRDTQVQPGHTYRYAVSAMSQSGHESSRSDETQETVPKL